MGKVRSKSEPGPSSSGSKEDRIRGIRNKIRRTEEISKIKREKKKEKRERQQERKRRSEAMGEKAPPRLIPRTLENTREKDETAVEHDEGQTNPRIDEEVEWDICNDEFRDYFAKTYEPKVLITCSDNPHSKTMAFIRELARIIPNSEPYFRKNASVKKTVKQAIAKGVTDVIVVNEDNRKPNGMLVSHLPDGPTAHFRLSNVKVARELRKDFRQISAHRPEVILNNFGTRLGHSVGRMLAALFHYEPQFKGRRAVTFHNQRDYIFFRHHMYDFKSKDKVRLREMGPRFTLKLRSLQKGTFDSKSGEYEWIIQGRRHDMETSRRRFFL